MTNIIIEKVRLNDIDRLQKICKQTFYETFAAVNTGKNMLKYLKEAFSNEKLAAELLDKTSEFYFAAIDNNAIAYLKLNFGQSQTELQNENSLEIERIYVLQEFQGKNVGQKLYDFAIKRAILEKACFIWLGVWEKNPKAISFYKKNGFLEFDRHIFKLGNDDQTDIMMKLNLEGQENED